MGRVCICALAKNENLYLKEWVDYHLFLGFDDLYIYDNNDLTGETLTSVISGCSNVKILDEFRGVHKYHLQTEIYTKFFKEYRNFYDWVLFIDIDEFVFLENHNTVQDFLSEPCFDSAEMVRINWRHYTDNDELDVVDNNYNVVNRFKEWVSVLSEDGKGKSFIRTNINEDAIIGPHGCYDKNGIHYKAVDAEGKPCQNCNFMVSPRPLYKVAWLNHYRTKTIGEFIRQKYFRGDINKEDNRYNGNNLKYFFITNKRTPEKEEYAKKLIEERNNKTQ